MEEGEEGNDGCQNREFLIRMTPLRRGVFLLGSEKMCLEVFSGCHSFFPFVSSTLFRNIMDTFVGTSSSLLVELGSARKEEEGQQCGLPSLWVRHRLPRS